MKRIVLVAAAAVLAFWPGALPALAQPKNLVEAVQYCTAGDMQKLKWFQQNAGGMSQQQQIATAATLTGQLSLRCQAYFSVSTNTDCGPCRRKYQTCIIMTHGSGPCTPCPPPCG